jgi:hypothetical protein
MKVIKYGGAPGTQILVPVTAGSLRNMIGVPIQI